MKGERSYFISIRHDICQAPRCHYSSQKNFYWWKISMKFQFILVEMFLVLFNFVGKFDQERNDFTHSLHIWCGTQLGLILSIQLQPWDSSQKNILFGTQWGITQISSFFFFLKNLFFQVVINSSWSSVTLSGSSKNFFNALIIHSLIYLGSKQF